MSGMVILFLLIDGAIKLVPIQPVTDSLRSWAIRRPTRSPACWAS